MCGIAGIYRPEGLERDDGPALDSMTWALVHRGPDDQGAWTDAEAGIALGHRRLSIVDLSPLGHQPMESSCGRWVVSYNGEVYGWEAMRGELQRRGRRFRGHSDTEVLVEAVAQWGVRGAVERCNAMLALAAWDRRERTLYLARDAAGQKPLYYGWMGGALLFGSELKALRAHPHFRGEVDRDALAMYLRARCVPSPRSIYRGIRKLPAGTVLAVRGRRPAEPRAWWHPAAVAEEAARDPFRGSEDDAVDALDALVRDAVRVCMVADVPLGAFLSGGVDSSLVVAAMQAQSPRPVRTFTIGFHEERYDEAVYARAVARHLGTDHVELYVSPRDALDVVPRIPELYDEPFADASQIPTALLAGLARESVAVALSGDGGDELFGGYPTYRWAHALWRAMRWAPRPARRAASAAARAVPPAWWDRALRPLAGRAGHRSPGARVQQLAGVLPLADEAAVHGWLRSDWRGGSADAVVGASPQADLAAVRLPRLGDPRDRLMVGDYAGNLCDDILVKVDRATMAVSLEGRMPLLDTRIARFAWSLPLPMKIRGGEGKRVLRRLLHRYLPSELVERPKMGFCTPVEAWLRGPLRDWSESLLSERRLRQEGFLNPRLVRRRWTEHLSGAADWHADLWNVLMFQAWLDHARASSPQPAAQPGRRGQG